MHQNDGTAVPLFPLNSVVLPGGRIPLQLFEPRYLDMLSRCLKDNSGFVVVLLQSGQEAGTVATFYDVGTYVDIIDFQQLDNGLLGIVVEGRQKVLVHNTWKQPDGLNLGQVDDLPAEPERVLPGQFRELSGVLQALMKHPVVRDLGMRVNFEDASQVGWRLTELLPLEAVEKQRLVEMQDPEARLQQLQILLDSMA
ncbi:MAG: LON peptidase substrate-binding domain-containing protein [Marinobacter sp.]|nr:LON peptidase substrate-binding domain-containing protein [Marinobacter sp.]